MIDRERAHKEASRAAASARERKAEAEQHVYLVTAALTSAEDELARLDNLRPLRPRRRWTLVRLMPTAFAIVRALQCVASGGVSFAVLASTLRFTAADLSARCARESRLVPIPCLARRDHSPPNGAIVTDTLGM